jgi:hypothetical protein
MSKRERLEKSKVFVESLNTDMIPFSVAIEILESKDGNEFNSQVDYLKDKMADLDKMFDDLIKEVND